MAADLRLQIDEGRKRLVEVGHRPVRGVAGGVVLSAPALAGAIVGADLLAVVEQRTREGVVAARLQRRVIDEGREPGFDRHQESRSAFAMGSAGTCVVGTLRLGGRAAVTPAGRAPENQDRTSRSSPTPCI